MAQIEYGYRYLEDTAIADAAFEVLAEDPNQLFELAGKAMFGIMADINNIPPQEYQSLSLKAESLEELLYLYLSELLYLKDVESMLFSEFEANISGRYELVGSAGGQRIETLNEPPVIDVKAVTYHKFEIEQVEGGYRAVVVVDL